MATKTMPTRYRAAAIAHVMVDGAERAMSFYTDAFGAEPLFKITYPDGTVVHAEMSIQGSVFMVGDAAAPFAAPSGGTSVGLHVYVDDLNQFGDRAARAGAEILQEPMDMFYGDRTIMLRDPFGHVWVFLTHVEDLSPAEIERRGTELLASPATS